MLRTTILILLIVLITLPFGAAARISSENFVVDGHSLTMPNQTSNASSSNYAVTGESGGLFLYPEATTPPPTTESETSSTGGIRVTTDPTPTSIISGPRAVYVGEIINLEVRATDAAGNLLGTGGDSVKIWVTGANNVMPVVFDVGGGVYTASYIAHNAGNDVAVATVNGVRTPADTDGVSDGYLHITVLGRNTPIIPSTVTTYVPTQPPTSPPTPPSPSPTATGTPLYDEDPPSTPTPTPPPVITRTQSPKTPLFPQIDETLFPFMIAVGFLTGFVSTVVTISRVPFTFAPLLRTIGHIGTNLIALVVFWKRRRPWGTVYDARTKAPLDPAYVELFDQEGEKQREAITDLDGRYGFVVPPGVYSIRVRKSNFKFPSQHRSVTGQDVLYANLYYGEEFSTSDQVNFDIPMDPEKQDWNQLEKYRTNQTRFIHRFDPFFTIVLDVLYFIGLGFMAWQLWTKPSFLSALLAVGYTVMLFIRFHHGGPVLYGTIRRGRTPLPFALVRVSLPESGHVVITKVADEYGRYAALVAPGTYKVVVEERLDESAYKQVFESQITSRRGLINRSIRVK